MGALERVVELLRPLVKNKEWDYCVIWKLGDDPSSFIKWVDCCCCGGAANGHATAKEESGEDVQQHIFPICKDIYFPHLAKTKACEALAKYPASMPLYSGIHGDVAISNTQMWVTSNATASNPVSLLSLLLKLEYRFLHWQKPGGTQVIIPVVGGLIELFSTKNVLKDQKLVEYITAHYNMSLEHEIMTGHCNTNHIIKERSHDPFVNECLSVMPMLQNEAPNFNIDGSPTGPTPLDCPKSTRDSSESWELNSKSKLSKKEETKANLMCSKRAFDRQDRPKSRQRTQMESYQSKNVLIERNRRQRIKDGLFTLRALVPKISKVLISSRNLQLHIAVTNSIFPRIS
ncbi:transcription factor bHLH90 [Daucus carota subsp. sativus]|uniref:transcription factor bHLH90 n=1 Tax=Daucus carota subsp. sativus TaxID=79200 RepID=UPI003083DA22